LTPDSPQTKRVLYVEDAFDQALLVKAFFKELPDFELTHAQDGDQALKLIESEKWDMLVTDLNLPGAYGFSIIRKLRSISEDVPILVTTGYTQAQYEEQALRAGADQVMIKPLSPDEFVSRVRSMIRPNETDVSDESGVLAIEGRLGDAEMGCGGAMMKAVDEGRQVVVVPVLSEPDDASSEELKAASIAAAVLGIELRADRTRFGDRDAQRQILQGALDELRPKTVYIPAPDDRDLSRRQASEIGRASTAGVENVLGYETATTGLEFTPGEFVDVHKQMVVKMEALATYQSVGAPRVDLRPRMAQAYARYWGRFMEFTEVEAFEKVKGES
jgi:DNA-binding response OmpR family regulator